MDQYMTVSQVALELGVCTNTVYKEAKVFRRSGGERGIPNFRVGGSLRISRSALTEMIESGSLGAGRNEVPSAGRGVEP